MNIIKRLVGKPITCDHNNRINRGDAGFCPSCGEEDTVFGIFKWDGQARQYVERFYKGEITHPEIDTLLKGKKYKIMVRGGEWQQRVVG